MKIQRLNNRPTRIIDHQPVAQSEPAPVFGKRREVRAKPAVTTDFFKTRPNEDFITSRMSDYSNPSKEAGCTGDAFTMRGVVSLLPVKALAAVVMIAVILPAALIVVSERHFGGSIDPITTASISTVSGLEISDVSLSRVIRQDASVATIFGQVSNRDGSVKPLGPLVISLYDKDGNEVQSWQHRIGEASIGPNQIFRFMTSAIDHSGKANSVRVSVAPLN